MVVLGKGQTILMSKVSASLQLNTGYILSHVSRQTFSLVVVKLQVFAGVIPQDYYNHKMFKSQVCVGVCQAKSSRQKFYITQLGIFKERA